MLAERLLTRPAPKPKRAGAPKRKSKRAKEEEARQRRLDLVGLGMIAVAVYLGYIVYLGWDGGKVGRLTADGLSYAVGAGKVLIPAALAAGGLVLVLRPVLGERRHPGIGIGVLLAGLLLALAAQTGGIGDPPAREGIFQSSFITAHGGGVGEGLYWATNSLLGRIGAHLIAIVLVISGVMIIRGRSLSGALRGLGRGAEKARHTVNDFATAVRHTGVEEDPDLVETAAAETERLYGPPEPIVAGEPETDTNELSVVPPEPDDDAEDDGTANFDDAIKIEDAREPDPDLEPQTGEAPKVVDLTPMGNKRGEGVTTSEEIDYDLPDPSLLQQGEGSDRGPSPKDLEAVGRTLLETLGHFGVEAKIIGVVSGPHVSRYELKLAPGTKVSKITQLSDDLAYALASTDIRILAPIPGKQAVGVEVPNQKRRLVRLGDIYGGRPKGASPLVAWLGKDIAGNAIWTDLQKMPHVLIAGTTGSGKSGSVNAILTSMLLHASPNELRLVLVDPKRVELNHYESVPHLLTPVVTSPRLAANVLQNLIAEMESRYQIMSEARSRNLEELNRARRAAGEPTLPYILCVIDELADLMMVAPAEVEDAIIRLAQKSRAVGIHLLLATQRPSTDIITGTIKVNIPARIGFAVSSQVDSRVILDQGGAEALLGQ
ncbi:MAG: segregation ATPase FtsK/SpoIIIE, family, partial [Solirubrobacterales bacterium]|nr:segregation ATPase FtsK/SpoIIIE, family [Solirubrobacterales bacterium]